MTPTDRQGEFSANCLFEGWKLEGRDLQFPFQEFLLQFLPYSTLTPAHYSPVEKICFPNFCRFFALNSYLFPSWNQAELLSRRDLPLRASKSKRIPAACHRGQAWTILYNPNMYDAYVHLIDTRHDSAVYESHDGQAECPPAAIFLLFPALVAPGALHAKDPDYCCKANSPYHQC